MKPNMTSAVELKSDLDQAGRARQEPARLQGLLEILQVFAASMAFAENMLDDDLPHE